MRSACDTERRRLVHRLTIVLTAERRRRLNTLPEKRRSDWTWAAPAIVISAVMLGIVVAVATCDSEQPRAAPTATPVTEDKVMDGCGSAVLLQAWTEALDVASMEAFGVGAIVLMVTTGDAELTRIGEEVSLAMIDFGETSSLYDYGVVLGKFDRYLARCRSLGKIG